jgi:uncharacterized protein
MKYLLVFAVVMVAFWVWRNNRLTEGDPPADSRARKNQPASPAIMVACLECGTHLPESEAVRGRDGSFCCAEHRQQREGRPT